MNVIGWLVVLAMTAAADEAKKIQEPFLLEEACNLEPGVVQHTQADDSRLMARLPCGKNPAPLKRNAHCDTHRRRAHRFAALSPFLVTLLHTSHAAEFNGRIAYPGEVKAEHYYTSNYSR